MKYILMDIEGTTTSISFVHDILFPYSASRLAAFVNAHLGELDIQNILLETKKTIQEENNNQINDNQAIEQLTAWIKSDRKHPALKKLQGLIWNEGYLSGEIKGHVYQDVPLSLEKWQAEDISMGIYSSGSIKAQIDLFSNSIYGDLQIFISNNFDTSSGPKREISSYLKISKDLNINPSDILFLSDIAEELDAAKLAGLKTTQLVRLGEVPYSGHDQIKTFSDLRL